MTHPADKTKAGYNTDKTGMAWTLDYGLKDSLLAFLSNHLYTYRNSDNEKIKMTKTFTELYMINYCSVIMKMSL